MRTTNYFLTIVLFFACTLSIHAQTMDEMWDSSVSGKANPNLKWFKEAKFGMFIHWGLYAKLAGEWKGKRYYGSGEWIMSQARIPVAEYKEVAKTFNPIKFNADEWAQLAKDAGIKYMVITAKHHEGFSMFDTKVSDFDIVDATPYKKDPMKALAEATRKRGIQFGFYYSQFQDWYEPNGGKNSWDFDETKKDYQKYYREKAIPQLKELLGNYGPLGIVWFDTPGGMTKEQTLNFVNDLRVLQPKSLFSSRVGHGLGDYRDFGDSEVPDTPIKGAWESIYTHNDSWGYIKHDMNFKTPAEIIRLLANVASKGGNLMLNVGPDGEGNIPEYSVKFLKETGKWLDKNGESIYGSTYGLIPAQPWGVSTSKPGKQYLHVMRRPLDGKLLIPDFKGKVAKVYNLVSQQQLSWKNTGKDIWIDLPVFEADAANTVVVVEYSGKIDDYDLKVPITVSGQYPENIVGATYARLKGNAKIQSLTYSHYYGDWKHTVCVTDIKSNNDEADFAIRVTEPGVYKIALEYSCAPESAKQEGSMTVNGQEFLFRTLRTSDFDKKAPLPFIKHVIATTTFSKAADYQISIRPLQNGIELFKLKSVILEPVK
ncbi:alpha-L-fucosidase [Pedobacter heparinus]|uniref:alpha-L-fucosidase n=1 Tax=Pedobacter heparinus (strain ATCC 13125 / DSM 2366 / CIP 104194 / JCM 7457 / NBRC 12017 / NCIMB 9290 / NRRL B-14731 / HIM 762-3) TaxID=485917 RepID=C6Y0X7_PEDHD|nr:alpha-L-fucosidase [Pedobacter heparinus]ACU04904.1 Alpha-L-fucosidase [Pedobacter heparinus DSM 2366]